MMKFLVVLLVVVGMGWWLLGRRGGTPPVHRRRGKAAPKVMAMVECAHCGVHLPSSDAVFDGATPYCGEPHRLAGPRRH
jgi:uncharacterized protein